MTELTISPSLASYTRPDEDGIAPGLMSVLRMAVGLRFGMGLLSIALLTLAGLLQLEHFPSEINVTLFALVIFVESTILLIIVIWPTVRQNLQRWFLPLVLLWLLLTPLLINALMFSTLTNEKVVGPGRLGMVDVGFEVVWLFIPVILAGWQYGRRGWAIAMATLVAGYGLLVTALLLNGIPDLQFYVVSTIGWLAMVALLGWVVMRLSEAQRAEHGALVRANTQLAQRAATVEQLTESRERNRMARELHDTLAHSLTGVSVQLQALDTLLKYDPEAAEAQLHETQATVRSGIHESRRAIEALRATPLEDLGLSEALRQLCRRNAERATIKYACEIENVQALDPLTEQSIYRVAEAAVSNAEQHAAATAITVHLSCRPHPRLEIRDDGIGFDPAKTPTDRYGLTGMAERADLVGGELLVESQPGQGTRIVLSIRDS